MWEIFLKGARKEKKNFKFLPWELDSFDIILRKAEECSLLLFIVGGGGVWN